jgi:hypothetical protein
VKTLALTRLQTDTVEAAIASDKDQMIDQRPADAATPRLFGGMHRLHLCVLRVQLLQCSDATQLTVDSEAEESDRRVEKAVNVKGVDVFGGTV